MAYNYLEEDNLADALNDSEEYMRGFYDHIPELQRITRAKPGKVPAGKPRVTDGTLAGIRRETPKQIMQQLPSGRVILTADDVMESYCEAILTDVILANANAGGTPYAKSKRAIKQTIDVGSAWADCFFNRRGELYYADYRIKYYRDVLFEKGKVSEFDTNYMLLIDWMTEGDLEAILWQEGQRKLTTSEWDLKALQELIDKGPSDKDEQNKTPADLKANSNNGYFKLVRFMQIGVDATFYTYAPTIKKVVRTWQNKDPRGVIPVHGLVPEDDDDNPLGEPLAQISAGKQNLLDFDMQMYQYGQGMGYSPTIKKWGNTPAGRIKISPDNVIEMNGNKQTDDFETVEIGTAATANFANNYGLIKSQILNETGRTGDTSISSTSGNPGFSKTPQGVKQQQGRMSVSDNDLRLSYELWQGRIYETLLNIHFAESEGKKTVDLEPASLKRLNLDKSPIVDYDKQYGAIKFKVTASTSQKLSDADQAANMQAASALMTPQVTYYLGQDGWKFDLGEFYSNLLHRMNIDNMDKILTKMSDEEAQQAKQQPFPIIDQPQVRINTADLTSDEIIGVLRNAGVNVAPRPPSQPGQPPAGLSPQAEADYQVEMLKAQADAAAKQAQSQQAAQPQATPEKPTKLLGETMQWKPGDLKPSERAQALAQVGIEADMSDEPTPNEIAQATDTATKIDKHAHDTALQVANQAHTQDQAAFNNEQAERSQNLAETQAEQAKEPAGAEA